MAKKKFVVGCYDDEAVLFPAVKKVRTAGYKIHDVYTPFAVHGLDHALGLRETSLHTAGFIYGVIGCATALSGISWILTYDWPLNIGGKPSFALPAWIPFVKKHHFHLRATDDLFVMVIECTEKTNSEDLKAFLTNSGALETEIQIAEEGWWFGRYDKDEIPFEKKQPITA